MKAGNIPVLPYFGFFGFCPLEIGGSSSMSEPYFVEATAYVPMSGLFDVWFCRPDEGRTG